MTLSATRSTWTLCPALLLCLVLSLDLAAQEEDAAQAWQRIADLLEGVAGDSSEQPIWSEDPWEGDEEALRAWCAAMADTHQAEWFDGMVPGQERGHGRELDKARETEKYFTVVRAAFQRLRVADQPRELTKAATRADQLIEQEEKVYRAYHWDYAQALSEGATMAPPLGVPFARELSGHLLPLTMVSERWCWEDPDDRG